jgi:hypothetical protein
MTEAITESDLLTPQETARAVRRSVSALNRDRWLKAGIPFIRVGPKTIRYRRDDIEEYLSARRVEPAPLQEGAAA